MLAHLRAPGQLAKLLQRCAGAYSDNTLRGYAADLRCFRDWCGRRNLGWLPACPDTVAAFTDEEAPLVAVSTLKRRIAAIRFAHRMHDLPCPIGASCVHLALRRAARRKARRPAQAQGLTADVLRQIIEQRPDTIADTRDAALIGVGYDTLCRSSELTMMRVEHLRPSEGSWSILVPISKGDQEGDGRIAWLSPATTDVLRHWLAAAGISRGPLFRSLHLHRVAAGALDTSSIRRLVKRAATRAGIDPALAGSLSGHSMRVGAAQDMLAAGFDSLAIMQAGGWRTPNVLLRYVENATTQALHERRWRTIQASIPFSR